MHSFVSLKGFVLAPQKEELTRVRWSSKQIAFVVMCPMEVLEKKCSKINVYSKYKRKSSRKEFYLNKSKLILGTILLT